MAGTANINLPGAPNYPLPNSGGVGAGSIGGIQGGALRPGAIDQSRFQQLLMAQTNAADAAAAKPGMTLDDYRKLAGAPRTAAVPPPPPQPDGPPPATPIDGIPNLTAEQFAVLTGMNLANEAGAPNTTAMETDSTPTTPTSLAAPDETVAAAEDAADIPADIPLADPAAVDPDAIAPVIPPVIPGEASVEPLAPLEVEAERAEEDGRVVWVDSVPDRDDRRRMMASGKQVRIHETPGARELFLGPDGKFGWDDALDMINPLQHIPIVAQIYRAVSGDQAYGLSQFAGAIPFGPLSIASAVIDTVVRSETGRDAGTDIAASILGIDNRTPEEANIHLAQPAADMAATSDAAPLQEASTASSPSWTDETWMRENRAG